MMRSLFSAVTGLKNHQTRMDVIANNVANVNTVGYKYSRVTFKDIFSQTLAPAAGASTNVGGINPLQVGLGMTLGTIDVMHTKSASQYTGYMLDIMIQGDGFFIAKDEGGQPIFTRAGNFSLDDKFNLVTADGYFVQGRALDTPSKDIKDVRDLVNTSPITPDKGIQIVGPAGQNMRFKDLKIDQNGIVSAIVADPGSSTDFAEGDTAYFGVVCIANFDNQAGLEKAGSNFYVKSNNSGEPRYTGPGEGGSALLRAGVLEMSNVDLANEFTDMIVTQRGFQANSRIITVSDTLLEELVNLKR